MNFYPIYFKDMYLQIGSKLYVIESIVDVMPIHSFHLN